MNQYPIVSIVGRQNVGKSTLFNNIVKRKIAITDNIAGVTRDVIMEDVQREEIISPFTICDTPGLDIENINDLTMSIIEISFQHLVKSDIILYVLDKNAITEYDYKLIDLIRKDPRFQSIPIIYCVNKADNADDEYDLESFYRIGLTEVIPVSALGRRNIKLLFEKLNFYLTDKLAIVDQKPLFKVCIAGKPNSGKSSLLNSILGYKRAVVSEIAGTTRDVVNSRFVYEDCYLEIIDTAGIRKSSKSTDDALEYYSYTRTLKAIKDSDMTVLLIDATKRIGEYDKKIFTMIKENHKPIVLAINKWDLVQEKDSNTLKNYILDLISRFPPVRDVPVVSISAQNNQRVKKVLDECIKIFKKKEMKISTSELNRKMKEWVSEGKVVSQSKKVPKIYYVTQVSSIPFRVIFFVNHIESFKPNVVSYFKKKLLEEYELNGINIEIDLRTDKKE